MRARDLARISIIDGAGVGTQGATSSMLLPVGTERVQLLPATVTSATDQTAGQVTCYVLVAQFGTTTSGISGTLCAIPGVAMELGAGSQQRS